MSTLNKYAPIGVFDSGLGGLTVVKELIRQLPHEDIVYFGDTARVPYGTKSKEAIIRFSIENCQVLLKYGVKMIVVACNSSSSYALPALRESFKQPIVGVIEPGAQKAAKQSRNSRIGVIATSATVNSGSYREAILSFSNDAQVFQQACPLFVPLVEEGWLAKSVTEQTSREYLKDLKKKRIDTLILGCTHYPLIKNVIAKTIGPKVKLVDSAKEVAKVVELKLAELGLANASENKGEHQYLISDRPQEFKRLAKNFLGWEIPEVVMVKNV